MINKKNSKFFEEILNEYERILRRRHLGENVALVKTAAQLTLEEEENLNEELKAIFGHYLRLEIKVDPELIGGIVVKVGEKTIDRSVLGKLKKLEEHIRT